MTFTLLRQLVLHASQQQPLVLAVENLHWSDPTSEEWLATLAARLGGTAILLLATYRPGYQPPWLAHSWATQVALPPLTPPDSLMVVQAVPQATQLSARQQQAIVAKAAGNPFFLEELAWMAVESGDQAHTLPLPETIQAVLAARLDHLPPEAKRLVQIAAVIGPTVPVPLLQQVAGLAEDVLHGGLAHLQEAELLYETRLFPDPVYTFKHALTQEVAYSSLLQEQRRALHAEIVEGLETLARERQDEQVESLAHHALRGEVWDKAFRYCQQAGARAFVKSAYRETVEYWEQALAALPHLPADRATLEQAIDLYCDLAMVRIPFAQWQQRLTHLRAAEPLAEALADHRRLARISYQIGPTHRQLQEFEPALAYCQRAQAIATRLGDVDLQTRVNHHMSSIYVELGNYRQAMACCQQMLTALAGRAYDPFVRAVAQFSILARVYLVMCLSQVGEFAAGVAYGDEARQIAEAGERPFERVSVDSRVGALYLYQGALHLAIPLLERAVAVSQEANIPVLYAAYAPHLARAYAMAGRAPEALVVLEQMRGNTPNPSTTFACGEVSLRTGDVEEAQRLAQRALADAGHRKMRGFEAWARWLLGEIARHGDPPDVAQAEMHYQQALALATELGMRPLVAHCHLGLGTLYTTSGQREQARAALAAAMALYRALDMPFWLPQAEAALAQVGGVATPAALPLAREVALPSTALQG